MNDWNETPRPQDADAVGIVVQNGRHDPTRPRAVAFVWGREPRPVPSLPFGRWKKDVWPAA